MKLSQLLKKNYPKVFQPNFDTQQFIYADYLKVFNEKSNDLSADCKTIGYSENNQPILGFQWGVGSKRIFMWAQMHGNESTASRALLDFLNFLVLLKSDYPEKYIAISTAFTLQIIPVLNPDGLAKWQRENLFGIDINRDAIAQQSKESKLLWKIFKNFQPNIALNLHDQRNIFHIEGTTHPATISLLAPAFDFEKSLSDNRVEAMKIIASLNSFLKQNGLTQGAGLYNDTFYPTSFGDNFQKNGASTILIESGAARNDPNRLIARSLNSLLYAHLLDVLTDNEYIDFTLTDYNTISLNGERMMDLKLQNVVFNEMKVDIGINFEPSEIAPYSIAKVVKVGDLSNYYGLEEMDCKNANILLPSIRLLAKAKGKELENVLWQIDRLDASASNNKMALVTTLFVQGQLLNGPATFDIGDLKMRNGYIV